MSIWKTVSIKNSKKYENYHETKDAAVEFLRKEAAEEVFTPVLNGGKGLGMRMRIEKLVEAIPVYEEKCITLEEKIQEYVIPK